MPTAPHNAGLCPVFIYRGRKAPCFLRGIFMARYTTKYFGDFEANDDDQEVEIETYVEQDGEQKDVSILINYFYDYKDRIDEIIQLLDKYFEMHEAAKIYIEENYPGNDEIIQFLFIYAAQTGKREYENSGNKVFSIDLDNMIKRLDPPSVSFQEYRSGKIMAQITYYCPDFESCSITITIDENYKIYYIEGHNG
jgi:hypothetical protein